MMTSGQGWIQAGEAALLLVRVSGEVPHGDVRGTRALHHAAGTHEHGLPLLILVFNNSQYAVMKHFHRRFYPDGAAVSDDDYYGVNIKGPKYEEAARMVGGYGRQVSDPGELPAVLAEAYACVQGGKSAIVNVIMPGDGGVR